MDKKKAGIISAIVAVVVIIILAIVLGGKKEKPTPEPAPAPTPDPQPTPDPKPTPDPEPVVVIKASGIIDEWGEKIVLTNDKDKKITLTASENINLPAGYAPASGDIIKVTYNMPDMVLTEISLITKENSMSQGTIVSWDAEKQTCVLKDFANLKDGTEDPVAADESKEIEFKFTNELEIPDGYSPQKNHIVKFRYDAAKNDQGEIVEGEYVINFIRYMGEKAE